MFFASHRLGKNRNRNRISLMSSTFHWGGLQVDKRKRVQKQVSCRVGWGYSGQHEQLWRPRAGQQEDCRPAQVWSPLTGEQTTFHNHCSHLVICTIIIIILLSLLLLLLFQLIAPLLFSTIFAIVMRTAFLPLPASCLLWLQLHEQKWPLHWATQENNQSLHCAQAIWLSNNHDQVKLT